MAVALGVCMSNSRVDDSWRSADLIPISEIMAKDVVAVRPELRIEDLEELLLARGISGAPVIDDLGKPIGMVSKTDLLQQRGGDDGGRVRDIMTCTAFCLSETESIARAAGLMAFEGVHRIPVVGRRGMVTGMVSPLDVMRWLARQHGYPISNRR
jgi:CBS-domain-containing membrane protein